MWFKRHKRAIVQNVKKVQLFRLRYSCAWISITLFPNRLRKLYIDEASVTSVTLNFVDCRHFTEMRPIKKINLVAKVKFFRLIIRAFLMT